MTTANTQPASVKPENPWKNFYKFTGITAWYAVIGRSFLKMAK
jgi:hypothetical protein